MGVVWGRRATSNGVAEVVPRDLTNWPGKRRRVQDDDDDPEGPPGDLIKSAGVNSINGEKCPRITENT